MTPACTLALFPPPCITPAVDIYHTDLRHILALLLGGDHRKYLVGLHLVPVSHRTQIQGQHIGMAMFNGSPEGFFKVDGVLHEKSVTVGSPHPAQLLGYPPIAEIGMEIDLIGAPG